MINIRNNARAYSLSEIVKKKIIKHGHGMEYCLRFSMQNIKEEAIININTISMFAVPLCLIGLIPRRHEPRCDNEIYIIYDSINLNR
jgi:hypothetical protein